MAWTLTLGGMARLRWAKYASMCASTSASGASGRPSIWAMRSRVMSSEVGPSPPVVNTKSARARDSRAAAWMDAAVIRDADLPGDFVAAIGQLAANPLLVRIENAPQKQFAAGVDEFNTWERHGLFRPTRR